MVEEGLKASGMRRESFKNDPMAAIEAVGDPMLDGDPHQAVANVGYNPTFGDTGLTLETHIMDFNRDIYGQELSVRFVQRLRSERKFESLDALKARIADDVRLGRVILGAPDAQPSAAVPADEEDN